MWYFSTRKEAKKGSTIETKNLLHKFGRWLVLQSEPLFGPNSQEGVRFIKDRPLSYSVGVD